MAQVRQEMPPAGGYASITYQRVPIKKGLSAVTRFGLVFLASIGFGYMYMLGKRRLNNQKIEMRCSALALLPMLQAEADRILLKQFRRNRDAEERIMKNVKGWEVGKWKHSPLYLSLEPDEYYMPSYEEFQAHADFSRARFGINIWRDLK